MDESDIAKAIITLSAVAFGFVLSQLAESYRGKSRTAGENESLKKLIDLENCRNQELLKNFWMGVISRKKNWFDSQGELNPLQVGYEAIRYPFPKLSSRAWEANIGKVASAYTSVEIEKIWTVYENNEQLFHLHQELRKLDEKTKEKGKLREVNSKENFNGVISELVRSTHFSLDSKEMSSTFTKLIKIQLGKKFKLPE